MISLCVNSIKEGAIQPETRISKKFDKLLQDGVINDAATVPITYIN